MVGLAAAAETPADLPSLGRFEIARVIDGDTAELADGRTVQLAGVEAPELPDGIARRDREKPEEAPGEQAPGEPARAALAGLILNRAVELRCAGACVDRYRRIPAHLVRDDGLWVQGELLRLGQLRVHTHADGSQLAAEMLTVEAEARTGRRGLWRNARYAVRTPDTIGRAIGSFQLVEGRVLAASRVRDQIFLNFGPDWKTDFTARIAKPALRRFPDALAWQGRLVRLRGWVGRFNGPEIELSHPEQVELIDPPAPSPLPCRLEPASDRC